MLTTRPSTSTIATKDTEFHELITSWKQHLVLRVAAQEIKQDTATSYQRGVNKFIEWLGEKQVSSDLIREWKADLLKSTRPASVNAWLAGLRAFFGWLAERKEISFDPTQAIKGATRRGTKKRHTREALTDHEVIRLLAQTNQDTNEGIRNYAIICVMLYTAVRGIELHRADLGDLKTIDGKLVLQVQGKGHDEKDDFVVLPAEAENAVRDWLIIRGNKEGALFTSFSNFSRGERLSRRAIRGIVKVSFNTAGIHGNKTTHSLRHTAITSAIRHNAPIHKVKGMSRHSSIDSLMVYYHEIDRLTEPAEKFITYKE